MIFNGRSVDALDQVHRDDRRDYNAIAIAAGWFSSLRRPGKKCKKSSQKPVKSAWDLTTISSVSGQAQ